MAAQADFRATKLYDILIASPLVVFYGLGIADSLVPKILAESGKLTSTVAWAQLASDVSSLVYFSLIITLVFIRTPPFVRSQGIGPRAVAMTSAYMAFARAFFLPRLTMSPSMNILTALMIAAGSVLSVLVLVWLGRSFSILPEARKLVTTGPYRIVRHPLYVTEEISNIGIMLQYLEPWSLLIEVANVALQFWRMSIEERVLSTAFPEYEPYRARTYRLIPGVY